MGQVGAGEMAQLVQCLPCKPEEPSRIFRSHVKRPGTVAHNTDKKQQSQGASRPRCKRGGVSCPYGTCSFW